MLSNDKLPAYSQVMDLSPIPFCIFSAIPGDPPTLQIEYANAALAECLGARPDNPAEALQASEYDKIADLAANGGDAIVEFGANRARCYGIGDNMCACAFIAGEPDIDPLTGLANIHGFAKDVRAYLAAHPSVEYAILRVDVDNFKSFNELYGMNAGDAMIKRIGFYLSEACETRVCAHITGDHFVMLIKDDDELILEIAKLITARMRQHSNNFDFATRFGVFSITDRKMDVNIMCDRALVALRTIKGRYGELVARYDDAMRLMVIDELDLISEMEASLTAGRFMPYLQPQYNQSRGQLVGAEALIRWEHPARGLLTPGDFLPVFERNGMITSLDKYMWEQACALIRKWLDTYGYAVPISVNVSRMDLLSLDIYECITSLVAKYGVKPNFLRLEITESTCMEEPDLLLSVAKRLRNDGFLIEMDDFGSGYSSLNLLKSVPVDVIKLDMLFLENTSSEGKGGIILNSVVNMAHWLGLPIIAEGVATARQADYLKTLGCDCAQGYYFSRPLPVDEFEKLLHNSERGVLSRRARNSGFFDTDEYWNPDAQTTVIFNSFVGAAGIFEFSKGKLEVHRVNDHFYDELSLRRDWIKSARKDLMNSILPEDRASLTRAVREAAATGAEKNCIARFRHPYKGSLMWLSIKLRVIASSDDRYALYASFANITQLRKVENINDSQRRRIEAQSGYLDQLLDTVPCGIALFSIEAPERSLTLANRLAIQLLGATDKLDKAVSSMAKPADAAILSEAIENVITNRVSRELVHRLERREGDEIWLKSYLSVIKSNDGGDALQWVFADMTAQHETEMARYSAVMFAMFDEVLELDFEADKVNRLGKSELLGQIPPNGGISGFISATFGEAADAIDKLARADAASPVTREFAIDGARWFAVSVINADGARKLLCCRDITAQKSAEHASTENITLTAAIRERHAEDERFKLVMETLKFSAFDYEPDSDTLTLRSDSGGHGVRRRVFRDFLKNGDGAGVFEGDSAADFIDIIRRSMAGEDSCEAECLMRTEEGVKRYHALCVAVRGGADKVLSVAGALCDINIMKAMSEMRELNARVAE